MAKHTQADEARLEEWRRRLNTAANDFSADLEATQDAAGQIYSELAKSGDYAMHLVAEDALGQPFEDLDQQRQAMRTASTMVELIQQERQSWSE